MGSGSSAGARHCPVPLMGPLLHHWPRPATGAAIRAAHLAILLLAPAHAVQRLVGAPLAPVDPAARLQVQPGRNGTAGGGVRLPFGVVAGQPANQEGQALGGEGGGVRAACGGRGAARCMSARTSGAGQQVPCFPDRAHTAAMPRTAVPGRAGPRRQRAAPQAAAGRRRRRRRRAAIPGPDHLAAAAPRAAPPQTPSSSGARCCGSRQSRHLRERALPAQLRLLDAG